ncbi:DNA repair protein RecN [Gulosibacter macacae]|uniref:DNA repair protein RecN n=1 Tax=Gulosibacter macacae TaxID=2488791 RepID=A0A3P3VT80_9MICO|nr:DNA repair protein RecN [Gulosibacter macacae]RRJ85664.1 DNA repair protein RecN [Gulosibacter macacae]
MLDDLEIRGLGVIDRARLELRPGFTAITGETGAGKTMVVTALGLLLGGRSSAGSVRKGAERAQVDARVTIDPAGAIADLVDDAGGEIERYEGDDGTPRADLLIARQVAATGRSRAWLGGQSVPASRLAEAGERLVAVHGQSEQLRLIEEPAQRAALDAAAGSAAQIALTEVATAFDRLAELRAELSQLQAGAEAREAERVDLRELVDEVERVDPQPDEDSQLLARIERLSHREELRAQIGEAHGILAGDDAPIGSLRDLSRDVHSRIERSLRNDPSLDRALEAAADLDYAVDELATLLAGYLADLDTEGIGELEALDDRLAAIEELKRNRRLTLQELLEAYGNAGTRLLELAGDDTRIPVLVEEVAEAEATLKNAAESLSALRRATADELSARVSDELVMLAMPNARFEVVVTEAGEIRRHGQDRISFRLRPHPGSDALPLAQGASGGELSRVMLALEVVLAGANPVPTLVFDEIDAGVGGAAALEIGARLQRLARSSQVVVVTHLAQVAAFADHHLRIEKSTDGEVTSSSITELDAEARVAEMTRLLSGLSDSSTGRAHAEELLRLAAETAPTAAS